MASETETVADIVKEVSGFECYGHISAERAKFIVSDLTRRFEAAHKREVDELKTAYDRAVSADSHHAVENEELRECLKQAVFSECRHLNDQKCETCPARTRGKAFCSAERWRKALEGVQK